MPDTIFTTSVPEQVAASITISGGGKMVATTAAGSKLARAFPPNYISASPVYAEFLVNSVAGDLGVGLQLSFSTMGYALDLDTLQIWFTSDGETWNNSGDANPATGVGGIPIPFGGPYYVMAGFYYLTNRATFNLGQATFTYGAPSGFSAADPSCAFGDGNPAGGIGVGTDGATLFKSADGGWSSARGSTAIDGGKKYFEVDIAGPNMDGFIIGVCNAEAGLNNYPGADSNGCGWQPVGNLYGFSGGHAPTGPTGLQDVESGVTGYGIFIYGADGTTTVAPPGGYSMPAYAPGDTIRLVLNRIMRKLWIAKNAGYWCNNPAADPTSGVGGIDLSSVGSAGAAELVMLATGAGNSVTIASSPSFAYPVPIGSQSWDGGAIARAARRQAQVIMF